MRRFLTDTRGNITIETVIWMPFILIVLGAIFSLHDAFREKSLNIKAAHTIADALSRETDPLNAAYLDGLTDLLDFLTRSGDPVSLRVTLVHYDDTDQAYRPDWSKARGLFEARDAQSFADLDDRLPDLLPGERIILVETRIDYKPPLSPQAIKTRAFDSFVFARPRFAPQLVWAGNT